MKSYQQFFAELKRRRVFQVAWWYGIVAFGVLQVADIALPRLGLPDWTVTFMLAVVLLLFPVALMLAWAFEVTPAGMRKTEAPAPGEIEAMVAEPASQRWPAGLLALLGVLALVGSTWWLARRTVPEADGGESGAAVADRSAVRLAMTDAEDDRPSLAVLPFADMSPGADQAYFSDGITEEILNTLAKIRELKVAARTSAFAFKGRQVDLRAVGDSLGVAYLIEGSVRKAGEQLRITAQLIDASDGTHLWSESYDRTMDDVFAIQSEIATSIAEALRVPLGLDDPGDLVRPTADLEAYDLYLVALAQLRQRGESVSEAIRLFEAAIARDSSWAPAWAGLAQAREIAIWYPERWQPSLLSDDTRAFRVAWARGIAERLGPAEQAARRALELDSGNASALTALGSVLRDRREWNASEEAYLQALAVDPDDPEARQQYAELIAATGRLAEASEMLRRAFVLDPVPVRRGMYGWGLLIDDRSAEGLPLISRAADDANGRLPLMESFVVEQLIYEGRLDEAADAAGRYAHRDAERLVAAIRADDDALLPDRSDPTAWMLLGRPDSAAAALAALSESALPLDIYGIWHPNLDPIRDRPEMRDFLRAVGLEGAEVVRTPRAELPPSESRE